MLLAGGLTLLQQPGTDFDRSGEDWWPEIKECLNPSSWGVSNVWAFSGWLVGFGGEGSGLTAPRLLEVS